MNLFASERVRDKLDKKHKVTLDEVRHCFLNKVGCYLRDTREQHETDPPTQWFISETNQRRKLKIVFIRRQIRDVVRIDIRTAYAPNPQEIALYERIGMKPKE
jgi:uncharacterized DUF497 family protein